MMNQDLEKQLKKALRKGDKNYAKRNGKGSAHMRRPQSVHNDETERSQGWKD